jgi:hypothetical protein
MRLWNRIVLFSPFGAVFLRFFTEMRAKEKARRVGFLLPNAFGWAHPRKAKPVFFGFDGSPSRWGTPQWITQWLHSPFDQG